MKKDNYHLMTHSTVGYIYLLKALSILHPLAFSSRLNLF